MCAAALTAACGSAATTASAADSEPPAPVTDAFCAFLDERAALSTDEVGAAFHAAQLGELEGALAVTEEVAIPALAGMVAALDTIAGWEPGRPFGAHVRPLVDAFAEAAETFTDAPSDEAFDRMDAAAVALRDEALSGEFARVGTDVFAADCS
jgi:hypothetical protein